MLRYFWYRQLRDKNAVSAQCSVAIHLNWAKNETGANIDIFAQICTPMSNDSEFVCFFFCKMSTYNLEVVLTLNVHVGDEIAHTKMAADNLHCNLAKKLYQQKHLTTDFVHTWPI